MQVSTWNRQDEEHGLFGADEDGRSIGIRLDGAYCAQEALVAFLEQACLLCETAIWAKW